MMCHIHDCPDSIYENNLCIFHCPKEDWFEIVEGNKDWSKSQYKIGLFWKELQAKFEIGDYAYAQYVFPQFIDSCFFATESIKQFKTPVSLNKTLFLDDALFNTCDFEDIIFFDNAKFIGELKFESGSFNRLEANYILLTKSFLMLNITFNGKAFFSPLLSNKIKITMIGTKILKDFIFSLYDHRLQEIFDAVLQLVTYKENKPIKNPPLAEFNFTGEINDKISCKFAFADSEIDQVLISNHNSGLFVCEQFSIQKILILDHFINFGKVVFLNVNAENTENISIRSSVFGDTFFEYVKWGNISRFKCNRDEFRQLKNTYDKQANYIEANKFYASEMEVYAKELNGKELKNWRDKAEYFLFVVGKWVSNHGQNWLLALGWILIFSLIMLAWHDDYKVNINVLINYSEYSFSSHEFWNDLAKFANPFKLNLKDDDKAYITLFHKIISGFLIYHFIIALRRNTKR